MANRPALAQRGPRLGDAASLWNFTASPGWTKEEAGVLKLCLMKYGIGRWKEIQETGLLPGKLIQQLNGQTQRLLGQQSLAAYTGLHLDIDTIRADNEKKVDAERKSGLIIWSGPNPTKQMREEWREQSQEKYGLTPKQIAEADAAVEELKASMAASSTALHFDIPLMEPPREGMTKEQRLELLRRLRAKLGDLVTQLEAVMSGNPLPSTISRDLVGVLKGAQAGGPKGLPNPRAAKPPARKPKQPAPLDTSDDEGPRKRAKGGRKAGARGKGSELSAELATLQGMGYGKAKALEALEESGGDLDDAVNWLLSNCV